MKFSESWLREWVNPGVSTDELVSRLTMAGLEVDAVNSAADAFSGVVVGEIVAVTPHPDADKLRVCLVKGVEDDPLQVICGAPNAREGIKVPFATVGAVLPGDLKITRAKLRGVESLGMLCAEKELGVSDNSEGLWELPGDAPTGKNLREYLGLDDSVIEVDLTPNRGDCLSIKGLASEVGVICKADVAGPAIAPVLPAGEDAFPVTLSADNACPRYAGRVIRNINPGAESPVWLQEKLRRSGLRAIDPVVDVTNYVMLELGQPMHAFDLAKLDSAINVRFAVEGESLRLLDGSEQKLESGTLVIADATGVLAIAGVMGGQRSAVSTATRDIFLESAFFNPLAIGGKARTYGLHTDSSHRFERGVDPQLCKVAIERATRLLVDIVGGQPGPTMCVELPEHLPEERQVELSKSRLASQLAMTLADDEVIDIFERLGLTILANSDESWRVAVPGRRFDIAIDADLIEEVARIYGYNNLPTTTITIPMAIQPKSETSLNAGSLKATLVSRGFREVITYSFVEPQLLRILNPEEPAIAVRNPISSDMAVMRTTLWAGLIETLGRNLSRQQNRMRLFETGLRFIDGDTMVQEPAIAGVIYGERETESWIQEKGRVDFYDLKGHVEALLSLTKNPGSFSFTAGKHPALHPGQCAVVSRGEEVLGYLGAIHPSLQKQLDLDYPAYLFELKLSPLLTARVPRFGEISRFPEVRRDIAVIIDKSVTAEQIVNCARESAGSLLVDLKIFDVYHGKGIENTRKSVALGLTYQEQSRTLNESEVTASVDAVIEALKANYQATLRG